MAVETRGIRHVHLLVSDHDRSMSFYRDVFGMQLGFRDGDILFSIRRTAATTSHSTSRSTDEEKARVGSLGGFEHFGITVKDRGRIDDCVALVIEAGGTLVEKGEHGPGVPYAYVTDPDGYVIEV